MRLKTFENTYLVKLHKANNTLSTLWSGKIAHLSFFLVISGWVKPSWFSFSPINMRGLLFNKPICLMQEHPWVHGNPASTKDIVLSFRSRLVNLNLYVCYCIPLCWLINSCEPCGIFMTLWLIFVSIHNSIYCFLVEMSLILA